jgi:hypothetical protein
MAFQANKSMTSRTSKGVRPLVAMAAACLLVASAGLVLVVLRWRRPTLQASASTAERALPLPSERAESLGALAVPGAPPAPAPAGAPFVPPPPPPAEPAATSAPESVPAPPVGDGGAPSAAALAAAAALVDPSGEYTVKGLPGARPIIAFDPNLWAALRKDRNRVAYLTYAAPVRACARAFVLRHRHPSWILGGIANVRMAIARGVISFDAVHIVDWAPSGNPDRPPDQEFLDCYAAATRGLRIACPDCKEGSVETKMKLTPRDYDSAGETLKNSVDPAIADSDFSVASAAP